MQFQALGKVVLAQKKATDALTELEAEADEFEEEEQE